MSEEIKNVEETAVEQLSLLDKLSRRGKDVLDARARNAYVTARTMAQQQVNAAYTKVLAVEAEIASHEDVSIKNINDLTPNMEGGPAVWVEKALKLQKDLYYARLSYSIAKKWFEVQFPKKDDVTLPDVQTIDAI